jgi:nucleotide-binding universal stress UspA family protein
MFNHVLVPLDGSELSEKALITARQVLASEGTLTLLSVIDLPTVNRVQFDIPVKANPEDREDEVSTARKNVHAYLRRVVAMQHLPPTIHTHLKVCVGDPGSLIPAMARALQVDAIVMSTHGRSGLSRWVFGSVTHRVLGSALCPVVVVPGLIAVPTHTPLPHAILTPSS